ncbi:glycosyltransferase [Synechococcus sp. CCY 9618]|uniref:glycosyltransferase n=1 Tax=Synechococcus sp. CCY 9618 TaxID=2815602 RepID=UPI001C2254E8|nr:glycosyltransferase [Synechococcus sp. CCY 9618]
MTPLLSLCIVVRNAAGALTSTLASVERHILTLQALPAELVLVDGESTDGGFQLASDWAERHALPARLSRQRPSGIYPAMNQAWRLAGGEWLLFINAGDLLLDASPLAGALAAACASGEASIQCQPAIFFPGARRGLWTPGRRLACHQTLVYRRVLHERCGPYDERLSLCADTLFMQRIAPLGQALSPRLLAATEVSPANASRDPQRIGHDLAVIERLGLPIRPWPRQRWTLLLLRLERRLGFSVSVWLRWVLLRLQGSARQVPLA